MTDRLTLTYEERQALAVIRKSLRKKPELAAAIMEGMPQEMAVKALIHIRDELATLLRVSQAFKEAAAVLAKGDKDAE